MKKTIVKNVILTIAITLAEIFLGIFLIAFITPSLIANATFSLEWKNTCVYFSQKQYEKYERIEDLSLLVERSFWAEDNEVSLTYCPKLLNDESFDLLLLQKDENYKEYVACGYVDALYNQNNVQKAIATAFKYLNVEKYSLPYNPVRVLCSLANTAQDSQTLSKILEELKLVENKTEEINKDIQILENILQN